MEVNSLKTLRVLLWEDKPSVVANRASITLGRGRYQNVLTSAIKCPVRST